DRVPVGRTNPAVVMEIVPPLPAVSGATLNPAYELTLTVPALPSFTAKLPPLPPIPDPLALVVPAMPLPVVFAPEPKMRVEVQLLSIVMLPPLPVPRADALTFFETKSLPTSLVIEIVPPFPVPPLLLLALKLPATLRLKDCPTGRALAPVGPISSEMLPPLPPPLAEFSLILPVIASAALLVVACPAANVTEPPLPNAPRGLTAIANGLTVRLPGTDINTVPPLPLLHVEQPPVATNEIC